MPNVVVRYKTKPECADENQKLVEAVCDFDGTFGYELLDGLDSLVQKSLLRQRQDSDGEPRFWMLETIREYGNEIAVTRAKRDLSPRRFYQIALESSDLLSALPHRLDQITAKYLSDPTEFWRVADANELLRPEELTDEVGRRIVIAMPLT